MSKPTTGTTPRRRKRKQGLTVVACPHCAELLTEAQIRSALGAWAVSKRLVHTGGRNGGRPRLTPREAN